jgi:hypothetical protein
MLEAADAVGLRVRERALLVPNSSLSKMPSAGAMLPMTIARARERVLAACSQRATISCGPCSCRDEHVRVGGRAHELSTAGMARSPSR